MGPKLSQEQHQQELDKLIETIKEALNTLMQSLEKFEAFSNRMMGDSTQLKKQQNNEVIQKGADKADKRISVLGDAPSHEVTSDITLGAGIALSAGASN